jgi:hypothetical protein
MKTNRFTHTLSTLLVLWAAPGLAQTSELGVGEARPWAQNVPIEEQQAAVQLFHQGNSLSKNSLFSNAVESYQQALAHWDHPAIHYNMAMALQTLSRQLELHEHLTAALRYDGKPLDEGKQKRAQQLKTVVEQQLARLEIICDVPGATVTMGDQPLCSAPSHFTRWVLPSEYTFTSTKDGYSSERNTRRRTLRGGESVTLHFQMYTDAELKRGVRWLPAWIPWTVLGGGAAIAASGGWLYTQAHANHQRFDRDFKEQCPSGCVPPPELAAVRIRGDRLQRNASVAYAVSGAALVTGLVLLYANQEQARYLTADEHERQMNIAPLVGDQRGVVMTIRY